MPRQPLPIGSHGEIWVATRTNAGGTAHVALTRVRDPDGAVRMVSRSASSARAAKAKLREFLAERIPPRAGVLNASSRLEDAVAVWREQVEQDVADQRRSPSTLQRNTSVLNQHILPGIGQLQLRELDVPRLEAFLAEVGRNHSQQVRAAAKSVLSSVLAAAVRRGAIPTNPVRDTSPVTIRRKQPQALSPADELELRRRLAEDPGARSADLVELVDMMLATGCRIGEMLALTWAHVDLGEELDGVERPPTILINGTIIRETGKGLIRKDTKSSAGLRTVELPTWARDVLMARWLRVFNEDGPLESMGGPVFPSQAGGWRDPANLLHAWQKTRTRIGFEDVNLHRLRKTVASTLDARGVSARIIADRLGHAKVSMTQDNYLGRRDEAGQRAAAAALERLA